MIGRNIMFWSRCVVISCCRGRFRFTRMESWWVKSNICSCVSRSVKLTNVVVEKNKKHVCITTASFWGIIRRMSQSFRSIRRRWLAFFSPPDPSLSIESFPCCCNPSKGGLISWRTAFRGFIRTPGTCCDNIQFSMTVSGPIKFQTNFCKNGSPKQCPSDGDTTTYCASSCFRSWLSLGRTRYPLTVAKE